MAPALPAAPALPGAPVLPVAPAGPRGPAGICPALKSLPSSEPSLTFADFTAPCLSCFEPTEFFGSFVIAQPTPPREMNRASAAATFAKVSRRVTRSMPSPDLPAMADS